MKINCDTDRYIKEVIEGGEYSFAFKDLTVIDIGCNIGAFSFYIYPLVKDLYSIDLSQVNIDNLNKTKEEGHLDRMKTYCFGISGASGLRRYITSSDAGQGAWRLDNNGKYEIQTYSLREFMEREHIDYVDLLKIDTEGAEEEILGGDFPTDKINTIVGEYHWNRSLKDIFNKLNYRYYEYGGCKFLARRK